MRSGPSPIWLLVLVLILIGCGERTAVPASSSGDPGASPMMTAGQSPLTSVTSTPSPAPGTPVPATPPATFRAPEPLLVGAAVQVAVPELNLRRGPSRDAKRVATLTPSHILSLGDQPVNAGGYTWYEGVVISTTGALPPLPLGSALDLAEQIFGWVAVARGTNPYVVRVPPRCPDAVDVLHIVAMFPAERLACFGDASLELEGVFGCPGICDGIFPGTYEPCWLACGVTFSELRPYPPPESGNLLMMTVRFAPEGPPKPGRGAIVRIRGHFDDDRAAACSMSAPLPGFDEEVPFMPEAAQLTCRQRFVVESYSIIGVDHDFPLD